MILLSILGASIIAALSIYVGASRIISALEYANPLWVAAALSLDLAFYLFKAARWRRILGDMNLQAPYRMVLNVTFIGYLANMLIPFRLGEIGRAYALRKAGGIPLSLAILSMVVESLFDTMGIGFILGLGLLLMAGTPALNPSILRAVKLLGYGGIVLSLFLLAAPNVKAFREQVIRLTGLLPEGISRRLKPIILDYFTSLAGLSRGKGEPVILWGLSAALWLIPGLFTAAFFKAFHMEVSMAKVLLGSMLLQLSFAIPAPPGYAGTFEAYWTLIYGLLGYGFVEALRVGVAYHLLNIAAAAVLGGISIPCLNLTLREALQPRSLA